MPDQQSGAARRRRPSRRGGASGAGSEHGEAGDRSERRAVAGAGHDADVPVRSNKIVQSVLDGGGIGELARIVGAELVLNQAGVDPGALGTSSNRRMGDLLGGGVLEGGLSDLFHATENITGPVPEVAKKRIGGTLGGSSAPVLGTSVPDPGMASVGVNPQPDQAGPQRDPNSLGEVFNAFAALSEGALDELLLDAGQSFIQSLGQNGQDGTTDLMSRLGLLPDEEDPVAAEGVEESTVETTLDDAEVDTGSAEDEAGAEDEADDS